MTAEYSTLKAAWHIDRIEALRKGEHAHPVSMQLIISDYCNHDCHWCAYRASNGLSVEQFAGIDKKGQPTHNPMRMIPALKVDEIMADAKALGIRAITWTGGGEPTAHPDHLALFRRALDHYGFECSLNTNGDVFKLGWSDVLPRFTYVRMSIDGGSPERYAKDRDVGLGTYDRVLRNLAALCEAVAKQKTACVVGAGYVVTPDNWIDLPAGVQRIRDAGAKYVRLASMQSTEGAEAYTPEQFRDARAMIAEVRALSTATFQVVDLFDSALGRRMDDPFCGFQQLVLYVGGNQKVYRCCYTGYTQLGEIGDLSQQSLADWFYSDARGFAIDNFDARDCTVCPLADKNETILYMIRRPTHVNFL